MALKTGIAMIREQKGEAVEYKLDREYNIYPPVTMGPKSITWSE